MHALHLPWLCAVALFLVPALGHAAGDPYEALSLLRPAKKIAAKEFSLPAPQRTTVRLRDFKGKVLFLNFWATWCPPCREEMPAMERLYQRHKEKGFVVLALSVDSDGERVVIPFLRENKLTFPVAYDHKMEVARLYEVRGLPSTFLINRAGEVVAIALGPRVWNSPAAHALVQSLLE